MPLPFSSSWKREKISQVTLYCIVIQGTTRGRTQNSMQFSDLWQRFICLTALGVVAFVYILFHLQYTPTNTESWVGCSWCVRFGASLTRLIPNTHRQKQRALQPEMQTPVCPDPLSDTEPGTWEMWGGSGVM